MGILMLATFTLMGMTHLHSMNGLKTLLGMLINGAANIAFFIAHKVVIDVAIPVAIGVDRRRLVRRGRRAHDRSRSRAELRPRLRVGTDGLVLRQRAAHVTEPLRAA